VIARRASVVCDDESISDIIALTHFFEYSSSGRLDTFPHCAYIIPQRGAFVKTKITAKLRLRAL